jgi:regulator of protease activity HflC (stomatin/prohibitin superfamily)
MTSEPPASESASAAFSQAAGFERPLVTGASLALVTALMVIAFAPEFGNALAPLGIYAAMLATGLFAVARIVNRRRQIWDEHVRRGRGTADAVEHGDDGAATEPARPGMTSPSGNRLGAFDSLNGRAVVALGGAVGLVATALTLLRDVDAAPPGNVTIAAAIAVATAGLVLFVAARWIGTVGGDALPETPGLKTWFRGGHWLACLFAAVLLVRGVGAPTLDLDRWVMMAVLVLEGVVAVEVLVRDGAGLWRPRRPADEITAAVGSVTLEVLMHRSGPLAGLSDVLERKLGLSLRSTWTVSFLLKSLAPLGAAMALVLWVSTALVVIGPDEEGVRLLLGRLAERRAARPGLHVKWPWPIETIERYSVRRAQTLPLGFGTAQRTSLLWAQAHSLDEYTLLLGDGRELISVDATVTYRIRDVIAYALGSADARQRLEALAYRLLMHVTVVTDLNRLLSIDRGEFAGVFAQRLQQEVDAHRLGIEILHVAFSSLHPPVAVASAYEAVVSAEVERATLASRARAERERLLPATRAAATAEVLQAQAAAGLRTADARAGASRFAATLGPYYAAPDLFRFRRRLEALEEATPDLNLFVVDRRVATSADDLWIDLRD